MQVAKEKTNGCLISSVRAQERGVGHGQSID